MKNRHLIVILALVMILALSLSACNNGAEYSVTFDYNYSGPAVTVLKTKNGVVQFVADPERDNYKFVGWYLDAEGNTPFTDKKVTADTILYAKWEKVTGPDGKVEYSVTFSINGGNGTLPPNTTVQAGESYRLPSGDGLTRDGYIFDGWKSGGSVYAVGDSVKIESDVEFAVNWAPATTITFDLNGGTGTTPQNITVKSGSSTTLPSGNGMSKSGYTFHGWVDNDDNVCMVGLSYNVPMDAAVTLYAAWGGSYTITLVSGANSQNITLSSGDSTTLGAGDTVAGKKFTGWLDETTGKTYHQGDKFVCGYRNVTLTAQYENSLVVSFCDWDGTVLSEVAYLEGDTITAPDLFITKYAEFAGWDKDLSTITATCSVTAQYNYTFTDIRYFDLDFNGSYSARYGGYYIRLSDMAGALPDLVDVKFPLTWKGKPIISIYSSGGAPINAEFYNYVTLESVYLPSSFISLPTYAFYECKSLREVTFSPTCNLTQIGTNAFRECKSLTTFTLPKSVTQLLTTPYGESYTVDNIGSGYQFQGCDLLEEFIFEEGSPLKKLAGYMFADCPSLKTITNMPADITVLPFSIFRNCTGLKSFVIPEKITTVGGWAFDGCKALQEIVFAGNDVNKIGEFAFYNTAITELVVPSKVTFIPHNMAYGCKELVTVTIGPNVETIDYEAFGNCPKLAYFNSDVEGLFIMPSSLRHINAGVFMYAASLTHVQLNEGLLTIGDGAFAAYYRYKDKTNESVGLVEITIPSTVTTLGEGLFEADRNLQSITILSTNTDFVTYDGLLYRKGNNGAISLVCCPLGRVVDTLTIQEGTVEIEEFALANTTGIRKVILPSSLKIIGTGAFQFAAITEITFNEGLEVIGEASFYAMEKLTAVSIPATVLRLENDAFRECSALQTVTFAPNAQLTTIGRACFYNTAIAEVEIPASVIDMGVKLGVAGVFQLCKNLKTVTFAEGCQLQYIAENTFNSSGLESIELPDSVIELRDNCLSYNNLAEIDLNNVVIIAGHALMNTKLVSLYIPESVTEIGVHAFSQTSTLQTVTFAENSKLAVINNFAFYQDTGIKELTLPASITNINMSAFIDVQLDKLTLNSPMLVGIAENAFGTDAIGVIAQLCVPANLVANYNNHGVWSRISAEIVAITD